MEQLQSPGHTLSKADLVVGSAIAFTMMLAFARFSSGASLRVTFVPGMAVSWLTFLWLYHRQIDLPEATRLVPVFFTTLVIQFIHFAEEFATGFPEFFPMLYGGEPYDITLFVAFNMAAYAVFALACILFCYRRIGFMLVPVLFFGIYGAAGNAISHSWWSLDAAAYRPGLISAQAYWIAAPVLIGEIVGSRKRALAIVGCLAVILVTLLKLFAVDRL